MTPIFYYSDNKCLRIARCLQMGMPGLSITHINNETELDKDKHLIIIRGLWDKHIAKLHELMNKGIPFITIDNGYFGRDPHFGEGYYRMTWNGYQQTKVYDRPSDRWNELHFPLLPWEDNPDGPVILCVPSIQVGKLYGINPNVWIKLTSHKINKMLPKKKIIVRTKPVGNPTTYFKQFREAIQGAYAVVTFNSVAAIEAVCCGIPVVVDKCSAAAPVGLTSIYQINTLVRPERDKWLNSLAYGQFNLNEMASGFAMDEMYSKLKGTIYAKQNNYWLGQT